MSIVEIAEVSLFAGAGGFFLGGALGMWLTRIPEVAAGVAKVGWVKCSQALVVAGVATSGVSTIPLAYDACKAPAPRMPGVRAFQSPGLEVSARAQDVEPPEQEVTTEVPPGPPAALRVQLAGGGTAVSWATLSESGGQLELEVVGLDSVPDPIGTWTVCVGIPLDGLGVKAMSQRWQRYEGTHDHTAGIEIGDITDRDLGLHQTYIFQFTVNERPDGPVRLKPPLRITPREFAAHRIGLGVAKGAHHQGRKEFLKHKSTLHVDCSR